MARQPGDVKPETRAAVAGAEAEGAALVFGAHRIGVAWLGLAILGGAAVVMSFSLWHFAGEGPWPLLVIWPVVAVLAVPFLVTRVVRVEDDAVVVERRLLGWGWARRHRFGQFRAVVVRGVFMQPRYARVDTRTPEGTARGMIYDVILEGRPRVPLPWHGAGVEAVEVMARRLAARLGAQAERRGYTRRPDGVPLRGRASVRERIF